MKGVRICTEESLVHSCPGPKCWDQVFNNYAKSCPITFHCYRWSSGNVRPQHGTGTDLSIFSATVSAAVVQGFRFPLLLRTLSTEQCSSSRNGSCGMMIPRTAGHWVCLEQFVRMFPTIGTILLGLVKTGGRIIRDKFLHNLLIR